MYVKGRLFICRKSGAVLGSTLAKLSFTIIDHAFNSKIPRFGFSYEIGPDWEIRSGFSLEMGSEKVRICLKKWSGMGPILENIGPIQDLGALHGGYNHF